MQGVKVNEALVQRLEKESLQLANDIKEKEVENELLREQISTLQSEIQKSNKMKDELSKVSGLLLFLQMSL
jgi:predicted  nucleic acid-binding Zn-ribbon protein